MKKLIILVLISLVLTFWLGKKTGPEKITLAEEISENMPTETPMTFPEISIDSDKYNYLLIRQLSARGMILINNTQTKLSSEELMSKNNCRYGINGGFYTTDDKPLGWMVISGKQISRPKKSELLNGFVIVELQKLLIQKTIAENPDFGLQTGPILFLNHRRLPLEMARDKPARRMIVGNADDGEFVLSVFDDQAETTGPYLSDLPELIELIGRKEKLNIDKAINLDGGSASAIYSPIGNLTETNPVGSWWCINN